jgi:hypothetical protein
VVKWGIPEPVDHSIFRRPRREFSYFFARLRASVRRFERRVREAIASLDPRRGHLARLRRRLSRADLH